MEIYKGNERKREAVLKLRERNQRLIEKHIGCYYEVDQRSKNVVKDDHVVFIEKIYQDDYVLYQRSDLHGDMVMRITEALAILNSKTYSMSKVSKQRWDEFVLYRTMKTHLQENQ